MATFKLLALEEYFHKKEGASLNQHRRRKVIWMTWERQLRNKSMSQALGIPLHEIISKRQRFIRYLICLCRTSIILCRERPEVIVSQNPSLVLCLCLLGIKRFFSFALVIDAHYGGVVAYNGSAVFQRVLDYCNRNADLVIVTNEHHADHIRKLGGREFVCSDPLPDLSAYRMTGTEISRKVFFICSFDPDEPFREVFRAAEILLPEGFSFFVSGNYKRAGLSRDDFPNLRLLGFIPESEFYTHLFSSQIVVDLTDNDNCLVCGAYEALEAGKPLVLSDKKALKKFFTGGTVFTQNVASDIAAAIRRAYQERVTLARESHLWVSRSRAEMTTRITALNTLLQGL